MTADSRQASICPHCGQVDDPPARTWCCRARMDAEQTSHNEPSGSEPDYRDVAGLRRWLEDGPVDDELLPIRSILNRLNKLPNVTTRPDDEGGVTGAAVALLGHLAAHYAPGPDVERDDVLDARTADVRRQIRLRADRLPDRPDDPAEIQRRIDELRARRDDPTSDAVLAAHLAVLRDDVRTARPGSTMTSVDIAGLSVVLDLVDRLRTGVRDEPRHEVTCPQCDTTIRARMADQDDARGMTVDGDLLADVVVDALPRLIADQAARGIAEQVLDDAVTAGFTVLQGVDGTPRRPRSGGQQDGGGPT